jgi:hypothetical protein
MALGKCRLATPEHVDAGELVVFEPANTAIDVYANEDSEFVLGSAAAVQKLARASARRRVTRLASGDVMSATSVSSIGGALSSALSTL